MNRRALVALGPDRSEMTVFARAAFLAAQADVRDLDRNELLAREPDPVAMILRATATPASTTEPGWAAETTRKAFRAFLRDVEPISGAARLIGLAIPATIAGAQTATYPVRVSGRKVPAWVGENNAIPIIGGELGSVEIGPLRKMAHAVAWTHEAAKRTDAEEVFNLMLREDVAAGLDHAFFSAAEGTTTIAEGLLFDVDATLPSGEAGEIGIKADLGALAENVSTGGSGQVLFVMNQAKLARLRVEAPSVAAALDIAPSAQVPADRVIAIDPQSILVSVDETPDIYMSAHAAAHMEDTTPNADIGSAGTVMSMWQTASRACRVIHELDFVKRRAGAVAFSDGVQWW